MKRFDPRVLWGLLLIAGGALLLLQNFGVLRGSLNLLWALLMGGAGLFFLYGFVGNRANWWALIPGIILLDLSALIVLTEIFPRFADVWGGPLVLGGIGLSFWAVYLVRRENWWAIIPGGVLVTLAAVAGMDSVFERVGRRVDTGAVFFVGLGLTFALVGVLPNPHRPMRWAFIPAVILLVLGLAIFAAAESLVNVLWPVALILVGLYLVYRTLSPRRSP